MATMKPLSISAIIRFLRRHDIEVIEQVVENPRKAVKKAKRRKITKSRA